MQKQIQIIRLNIKENLRNRLKISQYTPFRKLSYQKNSNWKNSQQITLHQDVKYLNNPLMKQLQADSIKDKHYLNIKQQKYITQGIQPWISSKTVSKGAYQQPDNNSSSLLAKIACKQMQTNTYQDKDNSNRRSNMTKHKNSQQIDSQYKKYQKNKLYQAHRNDSSLPISQQQKINSMMECSIRLQQYQTHKAFTFQQNLCQNKPKTQNFKSPRLSNTNYIKKNINQIKQFQDSMLDPRSFHEIRNQKTNLGRHDAKQALIYQNQKLQLSSKQIHKFISMKQSLDPTEKNSHLNNQTQYINKPTTNVLNLSYLQMNEFKAHKTNKNKKNVRFLQFGKLNLLKSANKSQKTNAHELKLDQNFFVAQQILANKQAQLKNSQIGNNPQNQSKNQFKKNQIKNQRIRSSRLSFQQQIKKNLKDSIQKKKTDRIHSLKNRPGKGHSLKNHPMNGVHWQQNWSLIMKKALISDNINCGVYNGLKDRQMFDELKRPHSSLQSRIPKTLHIQ